MNTDRVLKILESAVRAPSTHNSQPWLFKVAGDKVEVFYNPKYLIPYADKETRDLHISIGCMLENFVLAASIENLTASVSYGPFESKTKLAEISLSSSGQGPNELEKTLFQAISSRVNARGSFVVEEIPTNLFQQIDSLNIDPNLSIDYLDKKEAIDKVAELTAQAMIEAYRSVPFRKEMSHWMNSDLSNKKEGLPGYSLKMPLVLSLFIPIIIRYFNVGPILAKLNRKSIRSAPLIVVISGENGSKSWMNVGRLAEKIMLYVQALGYQTSIYVGSIEIGEEYKEIQKLVNKKYRPQFIILVGHIKGKHKITPRHRIEDKLVH